MHNMNILITGSPGTGKTTLVRTLCRRLEDFKPAGFYTQEIREKGKRLGFELVSLDGPGMILAHTGFSTDYKVGRYGVDASGFDRFLERLSLEKTQTGLIIIDEIGKMECFSQKFHALVNAALVSPRPVLATVAAKGGGLIAAVKKRPDVEVAELTLQNRNELASELEMRIRSFLSGSASKDP